MRPILAACGALIALAAGSALAYGYGGGGGGGSGGGTHGGGAHGGGGRGGGRSVHYIIIPTYEPGVRIRFQSPPPAVQLPMEITDAPLQRAEGVMGRGEVIAHHTFRVMDAVVLLQPIQGRSEEIPIGTVLAGLMLHENGVTKPVYCDLRRSMERRSQYLWDCFNDSNGIGKLDDFWVGKSHDAFLGFDTDQPELRWQRKLEKFAAYRAATESERPTGLIGYSWCGGDGVSGPPRFTLSGSWPNSYWEMAGEVACTFGRWDGPAVGGKVVIDRITATFQPGPQPNTLAFKVEDRIPAERIARIQPNGGVRSLVEDAADVLEAVEELKRPPFIQSGAPATPATGSLAQGGVLFTVGVKHSLTGVLKNEVRLGRSYPLTYGAARPGFGLMPGQVLYGARVGGSIAPQIVWCAPQKDESGHWAEAVCMPDSGHGTIMLVAEPAMMGAANLLIPDTSLPLVAEPIVERRAVDLPPMVLSYLFRGWKKDGVEVEMKLDCGEGPKTLQRRIWPADSSDHVQIPVVGGDIVIARGAQDGEVRVVSFTPARDASEEGEGGA